MARHTHLPVHFCSILLFQSLLPLYLRHSGHRQYLARNRRYRLSAGNDSRKKKKTIYVRVARRRFRRSALLLGVDVRGCALGAKLVVTRNGKQGGRRTYFAQVFTGAGICQPAYGFVLAFSKLFSKDPDKEPQDVLDQGLTKGSRSE